MQYTLESDAAQGDSFDGNSISRGGTEVLLGDLNLKADNRYSDRCFQVTSISINTSDFFFSIFRVRRPSRSSILVLGDDSLKQISSGIYLNHTDMHSMENGQHREMAVDVPESFIAQNKTQPRYPPPRTLNNQTPPAIPPSKNDMRPVPPPRMDSDRATPQLPSRDAVGTIGQVLQPTSDQLASMKKYQDQLRLRREQEDRIAATNEFLRNSVRGSNKLQQLKADHIAPPIGFDNDAYIGEDDDDVNKLNLIGESIVTVAMCDYVTNAHVPPSRLR